MQIVIDIPKEVYKQMISKDIYKGIHERLCYKAIQDGTPIPDNATNGDVIKAMFPNAKIEHQGGIIRFIVDCWSFQIAEDWWNAPYQKGGKE